MFSGKADVYGNSCSTFIQIGLARAKLLPSHSTTLHPRTQCSPEQAVSIQSVLTDSNADPFTKFFGLEHCINKLISFHLGVDFTHTLGFPISSGLRDGERHHHHLPEEII